MKNITTIFICMISLIVLARSGDAELLERVVAVVNDEVILLTQLDEVFDSIQRVERSATRKNVLNGMINSMLLLIEAKRFRIGDTDHRPHDTMHNRAVIKEYVERRIKGFIHIPHNDIETYYNGNREQFKGKEFNDVREDVEEYLIQKQLNKKLHKHIEELRAKAEIRIQFEDD